MSQITIPILENNGKSGKVTISSGSATNAQLVTLGDKIKAIVLGKVQTPKYSLDTTGFTAESGAAPETAQRGVKGVFIGKAAVTNVYHTCEIPTFDSAFIAATGSDNIDLTDANVAAFVTALQAVWEDVAGNDITVVRGYYANRAIQ